MYQNIFSSLMRKLDRQDGETGLKHIWVFQYLQSLKKECWNEMANLNTTLLITSRSIKQ